MERRDFIRLSTLAGAVATLDSCGSPDHQFIRFLPEEDLVPGLATWKPSVCTACPAGCGLTVRVMPGDAEVIRNGKTGLIQMGLAKKLEGNAQHPINAGALCPRGQAGLQALYHPDRIRHPLKRNGPRGSGQFQEITWDAALAELATQLSALYVSAPTSLAFLTGPARGQRWELVKRFLKAYGAPTAITWNTLDETVLRRANLASFGRASLPTFHLERADYLISFGADFLGTWNSPVSQSVGYGRMRQGRSGRRGKFVQIEPRMSQTGASADEWIPCRPGTEGILALGIAHVLLRDKLRSRDAAPTAGTQIPGWAEGLPAYASDIVEKQTGVAVKVTERLAHEIASRGNAVAMIGGAPLAQTNGLWNAMAVNALHALLNARQSREAPNDAGNATPSLTFAPESPVASFTVPAALDQGRLAALRSFCDDLLRDRSGAPKLLLISDANPVFSAPTELKVRDAILKVPYVASLSPFLDETSSFADLILPDHAPLESWLDDVPESGASQFVVNLSAPAVHPLHDTRAAPDVLLDLAHRLGGAVAAAVPWKTFEEVLRAAYVPLRSQPGSVKAKTDDEFWSSMQEQGGWWSESAAKPSPRADALQPTPVRFELQTEPDFDGAITDYPLHFLPFASQAFRDGSLAHLPWLQELPDPLATAMWSSWIEINPQTAARLNIQTGDLVEVASQHGSLRTPAIVSPGIAPDVIAMPMGQGHETFGRYASGRGANPFAILAALVESQTGAHAWAATRVKVARVGNPQQPLIMFAGGMSRFPEESEPR